MATTRTWTADDDAKLRADMRATVVATVLGERVTWGQLHDAFDRVADRTNWKNPIAADFTTSTDANTSAFEVELMHAAVEFFAGCRPTIRHMGNFRFRCEAVGYYAAVGA